MQSAQLLAVPLICSMLYWYALRVKAHLCIRAAVIEGIPCRSYRGDDGLSLVQMADHTGIDENDVPQTPLTPHVQSVHNLVQAWKVCVMHMQWAAGCHHSLCALDPYADA